MVEKGLHDEIIHCLPFLQNTSNEWLIFEYFPAVLVPQHKVNLPIPPCLPAARPDCRVAGLTTENGVSEQPLFKRIQFQWKKEVH